MSSGGLSTGGRVVPPEWIDYNGHMVDAYYFLAFTEATEAFLDHVGLGAAYRARTGSGIYTAESHLCFLSSVTSDAVLEYQTQLLGHDAKRLHVFHRMNHAGTMAATCELMFLHVSGERVTPMPPEAAAAVAALAAEQVALPRPDRAGRRVAMPQRVLRAGRGELGGRGCRGQGSIPVAEVNGFQLESRAERRKFVAISGQRLVALLSAGALAGVALTGCGGHEWPKVSRFSASSRLACPASYPVLPSARRVAGATLVPPGAVVLVDCGYGYPDAAANGIGKDFPPGPRAGPRVSGSAVAGYVLLLDQQLPAAPGQVSCLRQLAGRGEAPRDVVLFGYPDGRVLTVAWDSYCSVAIGATGSSASLSSIASDSLTGLLAAFDATLAPAGHSSRPAPSLVGLPVTTAARLAGAEGSNINVSGELVQTGPPMGTVLVQTPPPGVAMAIPDGLDLVVSVPPAAGCTAAELRAVFSAQEPGAGTAFADLEFRDVGDEPCTLRGPLQVTALDARGQPLAATNRVLVQGPLVLSPRAPARSVAGPATFTAEVGLSSTDYPGNCNGRIGYPSSWRITLADLSQLIASGTGRVPKFPPVLTCGGHVGVGPATFAAWSGP